MVTITGHYTSQKYKTYNGLISLFKFNHSGVGRYTVLNSIEHTLDHTILIGYNVRLCAKGSCIAFNFNINFGKAASNEHV